LIFRLTVLDGGFAPAAVGAGGGNLGGGGNWSGFGAKKCGEPRREVPPGYIPHIRPRGGVWGEEKALFVCFYWLRAGIAVIILLSKDNFRVFH